MVWKILKALILIIGIIAGLLMILGVVVTIWAVRSGKVNTNSTSTNSPTPGFTQTISLTLLHAALKNYHDHNGGTYPQSLDMLAPKYLPSIPKDANGEPYTYKITENGLGYDLCNQNPDGSMRCLGKESAGNSTGL